MSLINIYVSNQRGYIWDIQDVQKLRVVHHICGVLSGTLPQVGQQNVFLGLPLILIPEEVVLLVNNRLAVIVDDRAAHRAPTIEEAEVYHAQRASAILAQQTAAREQDETKRRIMSELHKDKIQAKKKQRESEQPNKERVSQAGKSSSALLTGEEPEANGKEKEIEKLAKFEIFVPDIEPGGTTTGPPIPSSQSPTSFTAGNKSSNKLATPVSSLPYTIIIQASSTDLPWHDPSLASYPTLESAKQAQVWHYPTNSLETARCKVFEDLWRKGNFMGGGLRFGGDFLVYPGDPLRYHSHFTLTVLPNTKSSIMPMDLVAYGRLATAVKKAHLLASWNFDTQQAEYFSLEWAAFG